MEKLGHQQIDLLKINIEGGEYALIAEMVTSRINVRQLVVEFHHRFPGFRLSQTKHAVRTLNEHKYRIFHISEAGKEYSFLKCA